MPGLNFARYEGVTILTKIGTDKQKRIQTFTCVECNHVREVPPKGRIDVAWCSKCMGPKCESCSGKPCVSFMRKLEAYESRWRLYREMGIG